jgi:hypothetical protein
MFVSRRTGFRSRRRRTRLMEAPTHWSSLRKGRSGQKICHNSTAKEEWGSLGGRTSHVLTTTIDVEQFFNQIAIQATRLLQSTTPIDYSNRLLQSKPRRNLFDGQDILNDGFNWSCGQLLQFLQTESDIWLLLDHLVETPWRVNLTSKTILDVDAVSLPQRRWSTSSGPRGPDRV